MDFIIAAVIAGGFLGYVMRGAIPQIVMHIRHNQKMRKCKQKREEAVKRAIRRLEQHANKE